MANPKVNTSDTVYGAPDAPQIPDMPAIPDVPPVPNAPKLPEISSPEDFPSGGNAPVKEAAPVPAAVNKRFPKRVYFPLSEINPGDKYQAVTVNGKNWVIRKGEWVSIPLDVAEVIEHMERKDIVISDNI